MFPLNGQPFTTPKKLKSGLTAFHLLSDIPRAIHVYSGYNMITLDLCLLLLMIVISELSWVTSHVNDRSDRLYMD